MKVDSSYVALPTSRKKIREAVSTLRTETGLDEELFFPIVPFLEVLMPLVFPKFNCEIVEKAEMGTILGLACPEKNVIYLREDVYDGAVDDIPMHRFTIAHEIGHFFMHTPKTVGFARNSSTKIPPFFDIEWQANTFAAELLAPPRLLKGLNRKEIQKVFGVSAKVAEIQSKQIS